MLLLLAQEPQKKTRDTEVTSLTAAKEISIDAAVSSELADIFTLKEKQQ